MPTSSCSSACADETVLGLPESKGIIVELQGYNVADPESLTDFANWELGARDDAIDAYGPEAAVVRLHEGLLRHRSMWQLADRNDVIAEGGDPFDAERDREALADLGTLPRRRSAAGRLRRSTREYQSICKRTATYLVWDGKRSPPTLTSGPSTSMSPT